MRIKHEWRYFWFRWAKNLENQKALRLNFMLQVLSMVINNLVFFTIWISFSKAVGTINGWGWQQMLGMLSFSMLIYGITETLFGSQHMLEDAVPTGKFDIFLIRPKVLYLRILNNDFTPSGFGDLSQGLIGLGLYFYFNHTPVVDVLLMALMIVPGCFAAVSFIMCVNCLIFWLPQTPMVGLLLKDVFYLPTFQPITFLHGKMRLFYMVIVPVMLTGTFPLEIVTYRKYELIPLGYAIAAVWFGFSVWLLKTATRRYESGNVIG